MKGKTKIIASFLVILGMLTIYGCGCKPQNPKQYSLKLEIWGFSDDRDALTPIFENYKKINPNVTTIEYKKLSVDTYKKEVIDALASGQGPDIFLIHNTWLSDFADKIVPCPVEIISEQKAKKDFADTVINDFFSNGKMWAVPLSVDSLGLYYNKDLFNQAGITTPPKFWSEFVDDVKRLTREDVNGEIVQSGVAMGTADNVNRAADILSLLMLQSGSDVVNLKSQRATFDSQSIAGGGGNSISAGENALNFYTQFARSGSSSYTWNSRQHYSIDAFSEGRVAMMLNYSWHLDTIRAKAPKLNFAVAPIPQFPGTLPINYPNYYGFAVSKVKAPVSDQKGGVASVPVTPEIREAEAWKLLSFLTTQPEAPIKITTEVAGNTQVVSENYDPTQEYILKTKQPSGRRDIIESQKSDPDLSSFAFGNLNAKSFYQKNPEVVEGTFLEIIGNVNRGQMTVSEAIKLAAARINQTMSK